MPAGDRADAENVPSPRPLLLAATLAICLYACSAVFARSVDLAQSSTSPGASSTRIATSAKRHRHRSHARRHHKRRAKVCAKRSGTRISGGGHPTRHRRRHAKCQRQRSHAKAKHRARRHRHSSPPIRRVPAAAHSSTCPDTDLTPDGQDLGRIRAAVLCLINRERASHGEGSLQPVERLELAAQRHSEDMALANYFEHDGPRGDTLLSRVRASGYVYSSQIGYELGENIGYGTLWLAQPRSIVAAWMASPGHRANILNAGFRDSGIGVFAHAPASFARGQSGAIYTQDFGVLHRG